MVLWLCAPFGPAVVGCLREITQGEPGGHNVTAARRSFGCLSTGGTGRCRVRQQEMKRESDRGGEEEARCKMPRQADWAAGSLVAQVSMHMKRDRGEPLTRAGERGEDALEAASAFKWPVVKTILHRKWHRIVPAGPDALLDSELPDRVGGWLEGEWPSRRLG